MNSDTEQVEQNAKTQKSLTHYIISTILIIVVIAFLAAISSPMVIRSKMKSPESEAISNAKQIGLALYSFEDEYDSYPSDKTIYLIKEINPDQSHDFSGNSSNAAFRQLIAAGITESEALFYAKIKNSRKPDGNISTGEALKNGEVGFSYISGISSKNDPKTPIVLTPLISGTTKFDSKPFEGRAIILHIDNSVSTYLIHEDGHIYDKHGVELLHPMNTIWNGKAPDIRYPE